MLRDSRKAFENGLPPNTADGGRCLYDANTAVGVVPTTQSVVNAFAITDDNSYRYPGCRMDGSGRCTSGYRRP
jgi:hypothetical protein